VIRVIKQVWWNTPWIAVYLTNGRAVVIGAILLMWLTVGVVIGLGFGRKYG
jgi:hypothetical protein